MRVLALVPGGMDEQLRFFPAINQIKSTFEQADIAVVADPSATDIYRLSKLVSAVIPYGFQTQNSPADWANLLGIMRDREFEVVITLTQSWSMGLLLWLSGVPTRIGYASSANNLFLTNTVPLNQEQPVIHQYQDLLKLINVTTPGSPLEVNVPQGDITTVDALRQGNGLTEGYVLVYPGVTSSGEFYGIDGWITILKDFQQRQPDLPVVLAKTSDSAAAIAAIEREMPGLTILEPENAGQMAALIAGANLLVTVDSYPLYLATALKVYTVGLFAQEEPEKLLPAADDESRTLAISSPNGTLAAIPPDLILKKIWNEA
jgi:ADP-heptose:LPS heptosyltransferase